MQPIRTPAAQTYPFPPRRCVAFTDVLDMGHGTSCGLSTSSPRFVGPGFFDVLEIRVLAGRDFTDADGRDSERVVIVSQGIAQRLFPNGDALNRKLWLTESRYELRNRSEPARIVGIVADVDDENVARGPAITLAVGSTPRHRLRRVLSEARPSWPR